MKIILLYHMYIDMEQKGNCGKTSIFLCKRRAPLSEALSVDNTNLSQASRSSFSSSQKQKIQDWHRPFKAQFTATRGNHAFYKI